MGTLSFITKLGKFQMSSEKISQELLEKLNDRFEVVSQSIGELNRRRGYYINLYGYPILEEVFKQLSIEKAKLDIQMEAIKNYLNE
jgi:hypothetical protein